MRKVGVVRVAGGIVAGVTTLLAACGGTAMTPSTRLPNLDGTDWVLTELTGRTLLDRSKPTVQFAGDRVTGSDGCNRYTGRYTVAKQAFKVVPPLASTQMACAPEITGQAGAFIEALSVAGSYRIKDDQLELLAASGGVLARFAPQSPELANTSWHVVGIDNGKAGVANLLAGTNVTVQFAGDGQASGWASCNRWSAGYQAERSHLKFGKAAVTRKACAEPGVMEQERQFLAALASVATMRIDGDRLEMRTPDGGVALMLYREGSD